MEITKVDWQEVHEIMTKQDITTKFFSLMEAKTIEMNEFWNQLYPVLASIKPVKESNGLYSAKATINFLGQNKYEEVDTPYGKTTYKNLSYLMSVLASVPRSKLLSYRMTAPNGRMYSTLVPLFLAAHRKYNNIKYNDWNKDDSHIKHVLGYQLAGILDVSPNFAIDITKLDTYRKEALTTRTTGELRPITSPITKKFKLPSIDGREVLFKPYHVVPHILLQIWVANIQFRHEDMILDLKDWDNMPEAYDATMEIASSYHKKNEDMPF